MQNTISNSCLPVDILDQIHTLIGLGYQSYDELDREMKMSLCDAYLNNRGITIHDLQCDLDIKILFNKKTTLNNVISQLFEPIDAAYGNDINDLFISAVMDLEHPNEHWADYHPDDYR